MHLSSWPTGTISDPPAPTCAALPSGQAAYGLVSGDWSCLVPVIGTMVARGALIGVGMAVSGERKHLLRNAAAGAVAVEGFVLLWAAWKRSQT